MRFAKLYVTVGVVLVVGAAGGWYAEHLVTQRVGNQVVSMLSDPSVQNELAGIENSVDVGSALANQIGNSTGIETNHIATSNAPVNSTDTSSHTRTQGDQQAKSGSPSSVTQNPSVGNPSAGNPSSGGSSQSTSSSSSTTSTPSGIPQFTSRQQLIQFAESRFTKQQIASYLKLYMNRASLTQQQKADIKQQILSHFTPAEIQAMEAAAKKYQ